MEAIVVCVPFTVKLPARVALAPLKVNAVVVPDLIIRFPLVLVKLPKVVPASFKNTSPPSASNTISVVASRVIVEPLSISAITGVVRVTPAKSPCNICPSALYEFQLIMLTPNHKLCKSLYCPHYFHH